jgi:predicted phage tail protein
MITLKLRGWMGETFGKEFKFNTKSARGAIDILCANFPGVKTKIADGHYQICVGPKPDDKGSVQLNEELVGMEFINDVTIWITPTLVGAAGGSWTQIIAGTALIVAGTFVPYVGGYMQTAGIGMILMGASSLLSPPINNSSPGDYDRGESAKSILFRGTKNTEGQGGSLAYHFGRFFSGSTLGAVGLQAKDMPT